MGHILDDGIIAMLNNMNPSAQNTLLGTKLDEALAGVLPSGSVTTAELEDGILSADTAGRAKMATSFFSADATGRGKFADSFVSTEKEVITPFVASAVLTAIAAATPVPIIADAAVPAGKKIYITGILAIVSGATAWADATATIVSVVDTATSPVTALDIAKAGLTGNAVIASLDNANVTLATAISTGVGMTAAKGISVVGDANFAAGSDIKITVFGFIK
jgi:hypothetical protein